MAAFWALGLYLGRNLVTQNDYDDVRVAFSGWQCVGGAGGKSTDLQARPHDEVSGQQLASHFSALAA